MDLNEKDNSVREMTPGTPLRFSPRRTSSRNSELSADMAIDEGMATSQCQSQLPEAINFKSKVAREVMHIILESHGAIAAAFRADENITHNTQGTNTDKCLGCHDLANKLVAEQAEVANCEGRINSLETELTSVKRTHAESCANYETQVFVQNEELNTANFELAKKKKELADRSSSLIQMTIERNNALAQLNQINMLSKTISTGFDLPIIPGASDESNEVAIDIECEGTASNDEVSAMGSPKSDRAVSPALSTVSTTSSVKASKITTKMTNRSGKAVLTPVPGIRDTLVSLNKKFVHDQTLATPTDVPEDIMKFKEAAKCLPTDPEELEELFYGFQKSSFIGREEGRPNLFHFWYWRKWSPGCPVCGTCISQTKPSTILSHSKTVTHGFSDGQGGVTVVFHIIPEPKK